MSYQTPEFSRKACSAGSLDTSKYFSRRKDAPIYNEFSLGSKTSGPSRDVDSLDRTPAQGGPGLRTAEFCKDDLGVNLPVLDLVGTHKKIDGQERIYRYARKTFHSPYLSWRLSTASMCQSYGLLAKTGLPPVEYGVTSYNPQKPFILSGTPLCYTKYSPKDTRCYT